MSTAPETKKTRIEGVFESILRRASYDTAFRTLALSNTDKLLATYGIKLPKEQKIIFVEHESQSTENTITLPPIIKISLDDTDLKVIVGENELNLARYENWSSDRVAKLFAGVSYENWGGE
ncbi:hypothetical protein [Pseudomonas lini]